MLLSEWELWACAEHYVNRYGAHAAEEADKRANELAAGGDFRGEANFRAIVRRIGDLQAEPNGPLN